MRLHVGATLERPPGHGYYAAGLSLIELSPRGPLLKPGTMTRWRTEVPESAQLSFLLPKDAWLAPRGALRFDDDTAYRWIDTLSAQLRPTSLVLRTAAELSPSPRDRELLARYAERVQKGGSKLVWQAGGVWEGEAAHALGKELGFLVVWDAVDDPDTTPGPTSYVRLRALGIRSRLGEGLLSTVAERVLASGAEEVSVAMESPVGTKKARTFLKLLAGELEGTEGVADDGEEDGDDEEASADGDE